VIATAILAAGAARRMRGADKLLEPVAGEAVLRRITRAAAATGGPVAVTLRAPDPARVAVLEGLGATLLPVPESDEGMSASIRAAAGWALGLGAAGLILCPADLPGLGPADFAALAAAFDPAGPPLRAADDRGQPGHPVAFPARFLPDLAGLHGDAGAQGLLRAHPPRLLPRPHRGPTLDLDTPEDWAAWRAADRPGNRND
jgi:CTP:molybdopterin cytidylyltransferase MocA